MPQLQQLTPSLQQQQQQNSNGDEQG